MCDFVQNDNYTNIYFTIFFNKTNVFNAKLTIS